MDLQLFVTPGLGDNSYLLASGMDAVLIDPQRDVWRFIGAAKERGLRVRYVLETHVHNDYVSGARDLQEQTGAEVAAPRKGHYSFPHRAVSEGDELRIGDLRLTVLETPGHTPEHVSYLVYERDGAGPIAVFSGGSLIVGSAGRSDLLGPEHAEELARAQYRSLHALSQLPEATQLLPTHGAGSFCVAAVPSMSRTSTIGQEREQNPMLAAPDERGFVRAHLAGLSAYPAYYRHMARRSTAPAPRSWAARRRRRLSHRTRSTAMSRLVRGWWTPATGRRPPAAISRAP